MNSTGQPINPLSEVDEQELQHFKVARAGMALEHFNKYCGPVFRLFYPQITQIPADWSRFSVGECLHVPSGASPFFSRNLRKSVKSADTSLFNPINSLELTKATSITCAMSSTPEILAKASRLAHEQNFSDQALCELVCNDVALTSDIIRISNSLLFDMGIPHVSLPPAVAAIGQTGVLRAIHFSLARQLFAWDLPSYGITARDCWEDAIRTAQFMEAVAEDTGLNSLNAHMIGILHAIGRLLINQILQGFPCPRSRGEPAAIAQWEHEAVGLTYAEAGGILLEKWQFSDEVCHAIRHQLDPEPPGNQISLLGLLQFSLRVVPQHGVGVSRTAVDENDPFLSRSRLGYDRVARILSETEDVLQNI